MYCENQCPILKFAYYNRENKAAANALAKIAKYPRR